MTAYYNEIDPYAADWLEALIARGLIAPGVVDRRSIEDVTPSDLREFTQCHFFAGVGVWSYALRLSGWADDRPVWTGSCPCQPFSAAGKGGGFADERHLWPAWFHLIEQCRPSVIYGEQVADRGGLAWLDLVSTDMEGTDYAFGAVDTCSAGFGAPHRRQRLRFIAMDNAERARLERLAWNGHRSGQPGWFAPLEAGYVAASGAFSLLADTDDGTGLRGEPRSIERVVAQGIGTVQAEPDRPRPTNGFWRAADWLFCRDGKWRPVEPGTFPLAHGATSRVGRLRAYGNAVDSQATKAFIEATLDL